MEQLWSGWSSAGGAFLKLPTVTQRAGSSSDKTAAGVREMVMAWAQSRSRLAGSSRHGLAASDITHGLGPYFFLLLVALGDLALILSLRLVPSRRFPASA